MTLRRWRDIWLNEGFAEFSSWLWSEHTGGPTAQQFFDRYYATPAGVAGIWSPPPGNPGAPQQVFAGSVYERGAMTLQALRVKLGDATFFSILRGWFAALKYSNGTVGEFTTYAAKVSGVDLSHFFDVWLYGKGKPTAW